MTKKSKDHENKELKEDSENYLDLLKRCQADFANYRKRVEEERKSFGAFANEALLLRLLPVLDNFKLATRHLPENLAGEEWVKGIEAIERQFEKTFEDEGLKEINSLGEKFDPSIHEAVSFADGEDGVVHSEVSKGYILNDKIVRPARVVVGKKGDK